MRVLVILFCNLAFYQYPDGTRGVAPDWNNQTCQEIRRVDPRAGNPNFCWATGEFYYDHKERCKPR